MRAGARHPKGHTWKVALKLAPAAGRSRGRSGSRARDRNRGGLCETPKRYDGGDPPGPDTRQGGARVRKVLIVVALELIRRLLKRL